MLVVHFLIVLMLAASLIRARVVTALVLLHELFRLGLDLEWLVSGLEVAWGRWGREHAERWGWRWQERSQWLRNVCCLTVLILLIILEAFFLVVVFNLTNLILIVGIQEDDCLRRHSRVLILALIVFLLVIIVFRGFTA